MIEKKKLSRGERKIVMTNMRRVHSVQRFCDHMRIRPLVVAVETPQEDNEDEDKREW